MNDKQRKAMYAKKKLKYQGTTVEDSWNTESLQTRHQTLSQADIDMGWSGDPNPFWKNIDTDLKMASLKFNQLPVNDQKKLSKYIVDEDNDQYEEEKEQKLYDKYG